MFAFAFAFAFVFVFAFAFVFAFMLLFVYSVEVCCDSKNEEISIMVWLGRCGGRVGRYVIVGRREKVYVVVVLVFISVWVSM
jgi:hypothetical protein